MLSEELYNEKASTNPIRDLIGEAITTLKEVSPRFRKKLLKLITKANMAGDNINKIIPDRQNISKYARVPIPTPNPESSPKLML
ncbi:MAG: hypothetical protein EBR55_11250 [Chitinophagia bacterium]|nr:hypothetical protein [Chitinophagia bacterium]